MLGEEARSLYNVADFGPRGYAHLLSISRGSNSAMQLDHPSEVYTFSAVMCWVACDRLGERAVRLHSLIARRSLTFACLTAKIAASLGERERELYWSESAAQMRSDILRRCWSEECNSLVSTFDGKAVDAYLLVLPLLG